MHRLKSIIGGLKTSHSQNSEENVSMANHNVILVRFLSAQFGLRREIGKDWQTVAQFGAKVNSF